MRNRFSVLLTGFCLTVFGFVTRAQTQTFDIEELPVLSDNEDQFSVASFINQRGDVLGIRTVSNLQSSVRHAFLRSGNHTIDFGAQSDFTDGTGLNDLGQIIGRDFGINGQGFFWDGQSTIPLGFVPEAVNNLGQVAGTKPVSFPNTRAMLWDAQNGLQDLGFLPGGSSARALVINERGHVAGIARDANNFNHGFFWSEETGMVDIGPVSALPGIAGMNDLDQILARTSDGFPFRVDITILPDGTATAVRLDLKTPVDPIYGPRPAFPTDINNAGQAVGSSSLSPIFWKTDGSFILSAGNPGGVAEYFLNDSGHVAYLRGGSGGARAVFWIPQTGETTVLPTLAGNRSEPTGINEMDEIAGISLTPDFSQRAVVWRPTGPIPEGSVEILLLKEMIRTLLGEGRIFEGDAVSLLAKLTAADNQLRSGNTNAAIGVLGSAQNQVDQLIRNGFIGMQTGEELIAAIDVIILSL